MARLLSLLVLVGLTLGAAAFTPAPVYKGKPVESDLKKLQGTWVGVRESYRGRDRTIDATKTIVVKDGRLSLFENAKALAEFTLILDEGSSPKVMTLRQTAGGPITRQIYRLESDQWTLSGNEDGTLPASLTGPGQGEFLSVLKRQKP